MALQSADRMWRPRRGDMQRTIDLSREAPGQAQGAAFYAVKDLAPGEVVVLLTAADPALMMKSVDLQLRHILSWTVTATDGGWRVEVRHRRDTPPVDALDVLERDHRRLDALLIQAMQQLGRDGGTASQLLRVFALALRRHMTAEDELLAPVLGADAGGAHETMIREHRDIRGQLAVIEECLAADDPAAGETGAFSAILSGTLAKHEHREESNLFPLWRVRLARLPAARQRALMEAVERSLRQELPGTGGQG